MLITVPWDDVIQMDLSQPDKCDIKLLLTHDTHFCQKKKLLLENEHWNIETLDWRL